MENLTHPVRATRARGASAVEFALLIAAIAVGCAAGVRAMGHGTARAAANAMTALGGDHETRVVHLPPATAPSVRH
jgi:Flp pilus assembly pilin Flp